MTNKNDQVTPEGAVELTEDALDQASGGAEIKQSPANNIAIKQSDASIKQFDASIKHSGPSFRP